MKTRKKSRIIGGTTPRPRVMRQTDVSEERGITLEHGLTSSEVVGSKDPQEDESDKVGSARV